MFLSGMLSRKMRNFYNIILLTVADQLRQKSFMVLLGIGVLLVLLVRSCYNGNYQVNGQQIDTVTLAWNASKIAFQVIVGAMYLMVALLAMKLLGRDHDDGSTLLFLSRPVRRWQYVCGRVAGVWILSSLFMFVLHLTVFCIMWAKTGGTIPGFLLASLICSVNLLFVIALVCLLSLFMPDIIAALAGIAVIAVGFVSDGGYQLMNNDMVRSAMPPEMVGDPALWRIIYTKLFMVQSFAVSLITKDDFTGLGPVHPVVNVVVFAVIIVAVLVASFNRREI
jgi:ABC-type transport system involved in multi-copper enzyme maturation permease subunit